jgi:hypothetical protein
MKRWYFAEHDKQLRARWIWRVCRADAVVEQTSGSFETYGAAVVDAVRNGFRPHEDRWIVESTHAVVRFGRGSRAVSTLKPGKPLPREISRRGAQLPANRRSKDALPEGHAEPERLSVAARTRST